MLSVHLLTGQIPSFHAPNDIYCDLLEFSGMPCHFLKEDYIVSELNVFGSFVTNIFKNRWLVGEMANRGVFQRTHII